MEAIWSVYNIYLNKTVFGVETISCAINIYNDSFQIKVKYEWIKLFIIFNLKHTCKYNYIVELYRYFRQNRSETMAF